MTNLKKTNLFWFKKTRENYNGRNVRLRSERVQLVFFTLYRLVLNFPLGHFIKTPYFWQSSPFKLFTQTIQHGWVNIFSKKVWGKLIYRKLIVGFRKFKCLTMTHTCDFNLKSILHENDTRWFGVFDITDEKLLPQVCPHVIRNCAWSSTWKSSQKSVHVHKSCQYFKILTI